MRYHFPNRHSEAKPKNLKSEILPLHFVQGQDDDANLNSYGKEENVTGVRDHVEGRI